MSTKSSVSVLIGTVEANSITIDANVDLTVKNPPMPRTLPGDLTPLKQGTKVPPRLKDTDAITVRDLARELGMPPLTLLREIRHGGEWLDGITSNVPSPVAREVREAHPIAEWEQSLIDAGVRPMARA